MVPWKRVIRDSRLLSTLTKTFCRETVLIIPAVRMLRASPLSHCGFYVSLANERANASKVPLTAVFVSENFKTHSLRSRHGSRRWARTVIGVWTAAESKAECGRARPQRSARPHRVRGTFDTLHFADVGSGAGMDQLGRGGIFG